MHRDTCMRVCVCVCDAIHSFIDVEHARTRKQKKNKGNPRGQVYLEVPNKFTKPARGQSKTKIAKKITKRNKKTEREAQQEAKLMQSKGQRRSGKKE